MKKLEPNEKTSFLNQKRRFLRKSVTYPFKTRQNYTTPVRAILQISTYSKSPSKNEHFFMILDGFLVKC